MSRMEWRAVSEHSPFQISSNNDSEFCSIKIDGGGGLSEEIVNKRIDEVRREREELEHLEIDLRVRDIVRLEISEAEKRFQLKIKEHADANSQLKDQIQKSKQHIHGLEMQLEEKVKEIQAIQLDNEASWAKDDLLREQNKELASFRRERDNSEAERVQHMQQMHDLQEHIQEKDSRILALEEQHRVTQETILFKDEQLREAQTWIAHVQEMDALQSTVLQAQLQERTEQFNQYWIAIQRQFAEVERHHLQTIQQLQTELANAREHNGQDAHKSLVDPSSWTQNNGNHVNANAAATNFNLGMIFNGSLNDRMHAPSAIVSSENEHPSSTSAAPSVLGMGSCIPPAQVNAVVHPFIIHPQQPISSGDSHIPQPLHPTSMFQLHQTIEQQQIVTDDVSQNSSQNNLLLSSTEHNQFNSDIPCAKFDQQQNGSVTGGSSNEEKMLKSDDKQYQMSIESQQISDINMSTHPSVLSGSDEQPNEITGQNKTAVSATSFSASPRKQNHDNVTEIRENVVMYPESESTAETLNQTPSPHTQEPGLLDERSLLVCIVRAIPPEAVGRIRISTTLPNRLAKMLAPHHWHDYRKQYGKLDDFLAHHPELFVIEGDFIHLRDGAQEIISATTAFAKVAAATAASSAAFKSSFRSVALTPIAQSNRSKTVASFDSKQNRTGFDVTNGLRPKNISVDAESRHVHSSMQYAVGNGTKGLNNGTKQARSSRSGVSLQKK